MSEDLFLSAKHLLFAARNAAITLHRSLSDHVTPGAV
jgi:hypothetical protein